MLKQFLATSFGCLVLAVGLLPGGAVRAQDRSDTQIAILTGEWKITFTNSEVRVYTLEKNGKLSGTADEAKVKGQIKRQGAMLLLTFEGGEDLERLTLGTDGRLFIERYDQKTDFPEKRPTHIGIGTREK